jgi:hypothetical protein
VLPYAQFWWAVLGSNQWPLPCESTYDDFCRPRLEA